MTLPAGVHSGQFCKKKVPRSDSMTLQGWNKVDALRKHLMFGFVQKLPFIEHAEDIMLPHCPWVRL